MNGILSRTLATSVSSGGWSDTIALIMNQALGLEQKGKKEHLKFAIWTLWIIGVLMIAGSIVAHVIWFGSTFDTFISFFCRTLFLTLGYTALLYALLKPVQIYQRRKAQRQSEEQTQL